jgi:DNA-binding transcriptional MerR regulator
MEQLREDFPDVSVSKIRFLESQGLINPGRTPSGYRQFSEEDLKLLRWILRQQREHYLPLKVIRRRLRDGQGPDAEPPEEHATPPVGERDALGALPDEEEAAWLVPETRPLSEDLSAPQLPLSAGPAPPVPAGTGGPSAAEELWPPGRGEETWSKAELAKESGLDERALGELEAFGLLPRLPGGDFDEDARQVADIAAGFFRHGVEARHLRMYKSFAEREAAFLQQVVMPMLNVRHVQSQAQARDALAELAHLGQALRLSMLRAALGPPPGE